MARGATQRTDFQWAARSALQKGIRRGDLKMAETAVSVLFETEPSWVFWRLPAIVPEEAWPLNAEMALVLDAAATALKAGRKDEAQLRIIRMVRNIARREKDRDPNGLALLLLVPEIRRHIDFDRLPKERKLQWQLAELLLKWKASGMKEEIFQKIGAQDDMVRYFSAMRHQHPHIEAAKRRFLAGGTDGDRAMLLCYCAIVMTTPPSYTLREAPEKSLSTDYDGGNQWPWYVYDMHTLRGKRVTEALLGRDASEKSIEVFTRIWFAMESGRVNKIAEGSFWWPLYLKLLEAEYKISREVWEAPNGIRDRIRRMIEGNSGRCNRYS